MDFCNVSNCDGDVSGLSDESPDGVAIPFTTTETEKRIVPARVTFEIVNARIVKEGRHKHVVGQEMRDK